MVSIERFIMKIYYYNIEDRKQELHNNMGWETLHSPVQSYTEEFNTIEGYFAWLVTHPKSIYSVHIDIDDLGVMKLSEKEMKYYKIKGELLSSIRKRDCFQQEVDRIQSYIDQLEEWLKENPIV